MTGKIDFRHDTGNDVVIAIPHWKIETEDDVHLWFEQYQSYFKRFGRKMDFIVVLDDFAVAPAIGARWGEYRARVLKEFTRFSFRVHSNTKVKLFVNTSGVRYDVGREEADSVEDAIAGIKAARAALKAD